MNKSARILVLAAVIVVLTLVAVSFRYELSRIGAPGVVILSAITMMALSILMLEHYFTRPTDVVATSTSVILLMAPVHKEMSSLGIWYWIILGYAAAMLLMSLAALLLLSSSSPPDSRCNVASSWLKRFTTIFANAKIMWFIVFASALFGFVESQSALFIWLSIVSASLLALDPRRMAVAFFERLATTPDEIARVIAVQSDDVVLAKVSPFAKAPKRFDFVQINPGVNQAIGSPALVVDAYTLDEERWIRALSGSFVNQMAGPVNCETVAPSSLRRLETTAVGPLFGAFVGVVREGSNIQRIKFDYSESAPISEGALLWVDIGGNKIFYQVTDGVTVVEVLESKNEAGLVVGEATQLGTWNEDRQVFERFGWLPRMNAPVFLVSGEAEVKPVPEGETVIGRLPGSNYPISIDLEAAISHHTAILGVTGSGKSVFAREFVRNAMQTGRKVICVDFTGEYRTKLTGGPIGTIVSEEQATQIIANLEYVASQMDEFANRRDKNGMATAEGGVESVLRRAFEEFVDGQERVTLFTLPDVTNSSVLLDYTKWFFKILFKMAKESQCRGQRVCVVLEEAHTVIPEWNFLGIEEKRATALVNSIGQIALQGRKYGVGIVLVAQRTASVSKTVLTQCNTIIAFQQFDKTSADFLANYMGDMAKALPRLRSRSAVVVGKAFRGGMPVIFQVPEITEP